MKINQDFNASVNCIMANTSLNEEEKKMQISKFYKHQMKSQNLTLDQKELFKLHPFSCRNKGTKVCSFIYFRYVDVGQYECVSFNTLIANENQTEVEKNTIYKDYKNAKFEVMTTLSFDYKTICFEDPLSLILDYECNIFYSVHEPNRFPDFHTISFHERKNKIKVIITIQ